MENKLKNRNIVYPIIIMLVFCAIVLAQAEFIPGSDDERYAVALQNKDWSLLFINNRFLINVIVVLVEACGLHFWKMCNILVCALLFIYLIKIALVINGKKSDGYINMICLGLIFLIPIRVLSSGLFWATGSFSYAWGVAGCLMYLYPFLCKLFDKNCTTVEMVLAVFGGIYAGNLEQTSAVQVCFASFILGYLIYGKEKIEKKYWILYLVAIVSLIVLLTLPFNQGRTRGAIMVYYPNFNMLSLVDKVYQGAMNLYAHLVGDNAIIMLIFTSGVFSGIIAKKKNAIVKVMALLPFVYFVGNILIKTGIFLGHTIEWLYNFNVYTYIVSMGKLEVAPFVLMTAILLIEAYLLYVLFDKDTQSICVSLFYLAGLASALILAFSPTVFVSGNRVFFLLDILLVLIIGMIIYEGEMERECSKYIAVGVAILDFAICIKFYEICQGIILY